MSPAGRTTPVKSQEVSQFFENLASSGRQPLLHRALGTLGIDLRDGGAVEHWSVEMVKGDVSISHRRVKADATLRMDESLFERYGPRRGEYDGGSPPGLARSRRGSRACRRFREVASRTEGVEGGILQAARGAVGVSFDLVKILDGNTFVVSDGRGDIDASLTDPTGLFSFDTRFLSRWILTINGERLNALSTDDVQYFESRFFLVPGTGTVYVDADLSVIRERVVANGFHEELVIMNHDAEPVDLEVRIEAGCDFADLFEVKDALKKKGTYERVVGRELPQAEIPPSTIPTGDMDHGRVVADRRRERIDVCGHCSGSRSVGNEARCHHGPISSGAGRAAQSSTALPKQRRREHEE